MSRGFDWITNGLALLDFDRVDGELKEPIEKGWQLLKQGTQRPINNVATMTLCCNVTKVFSYFGHYLVDTFVVCL